MPILFGLTITGGGVTPKLLFQLLAWLPPHGAPQILTVSPGLVLRVQSRQLKTHPLLIHSIIDYSHFYLTNNF